MKEKRRKYLHTVDAEREMFGKVFKSLWGRKWIHQAWLCLKLRNDLVPDGNNIEGNDKNNNNSNIKEISDLVRV